jgi:hypothetical protein
MGLNAVGIVVVLVIFLAVLLVAATGTGWLSGPRRVTRRRRPRRFEPDNDPDVIADDFTPSRSDDL